MNREYFTENLSVETLAKFTDKMLNFEKTAKYSNYKKIGLLKIIPAVAAIALVIGAVNILPVFIGDTDILPGNEAGIYIAAEDNTDSTDSINMPNTGEISIDENGYVYVVSATEDSAFDDLGDLDENILNTDMSEWYTFDVGENTMYGASTWETLYALVKGHFERASLEGKMTQEEVSIRMDELLAAIEHKLIFYKNGVITIDGKNIVDKFNEHTENHKFNKFEFIPNTHTLKNGITIETGNFNMIAGSYKLEPDSEVMPDYLKSFKFRFVKSGAYGLLMPMHISTVTLADGTVIETPVGTMFVTADYLRELHQIIVGDGDAVITYPDGEKITAERGTVIDFENGRIIYGD